MAVGDFRMKPTRIGLDVSKGVFELHGVDQQGEVVLRGSIRSGRLHETFAQMPRCVIGLESCGTAHRWGQQLASLGHEVRLMAPHAVAAYREHLEGGVSRAAAICEALGRSATPFTLVKAAKGRGSLGLIRVPARFLAGLGAMVTRERAAPERRSNA